MRNYVIIALILLSCSEQDPELERHRKTFVNTYYRYHHYWWITPDYKRNPEDQIRSNPLPKKSKPVKPMPNKFLKQYPQLRDPKINDIVEMIGNVDNEFSKWNNGEKGVILDIFYSGAVVYKIKLERSISPYEWIFREDFKVIDYV